jgi:NTE family protein
MKLNNHSKFYKTLPSSSLGGNITMLASTNELAADLLEETDLFRPLGQMERANVVSKMFRRTFKRGELLVTQGKALHEIFLITSGLVKVYRNDEDGTPFEVAQLGRGSLVGELSAVMETLPSANVIGMVDTEVWALTHFDFKCLLSTSLPQALSLNRALSTKLAATTRRLTPRPTAKLTAIISQHHKDSTCHLSLELARSIARHTQSHVLVIDGHPANHSAFNEQTIWGASAEGLLRDPSLLLSHDLPNEEDNGKEKEVRVIRYSTNEGVIPNPANLLDLITRLRSFYKHIIIDLPHENENLLADTLPFMERGIVTTHSQRLASINELLERSAISQIRRKGLLAVTNWPQRFRMGDVWQTEQRYRWKVGALIDDNNPQDGIDRLARRIANLRVGIAWGGGTARGWALAGISNALQHLNVPMDVFAGTSAGALGAAVYGLSLDYQLAEEQMRSILPYLKRTTRFFPPIRISRHSLLAENWWRNLIQTFVGEKRFEDMQLPFAAVALDLKSGQQHVFKKGLLWQAIRASSSVPVIAPPMVINGRAYSDGGVVNAVPLDVVSDMGADILIGIDLTGREKQASWNGSSKPHMLSNLIRNINVAYNTSASRTLPLADALIRPVLRSAAVYDVNVMDEFIDEGKRATYDALPELRKAIPWLAR